MNYGADHDDSNKEHGASGSGDGTAGGPDCEWKEHMRYFRHDVSSSGHPSYYLEAIGWVCDSIIVNIGLFQGLRVVIHETYSLN